MAISTAEHELIDDLIEELESLQDGIDQDALEQAIADGDLARVEQEAGVGNYTKVIALLAALIGLRLRAVFDERAQREAEEAGGAYDPLDPAIAALLSALALEAATSLVIQAKATIRGIIVRGSKLGLSPADLAARIKSQLWLLDRHVSAIDAQRQRMIEQGVSSAAIARTVKATVERYLAYRAMMIASSSITAAITQALKWVWNLLARAGLLDSGRARKKWVTAMDERVCPRCGPLHGVTVKLHEYFSTDNGLYIGPPLHPVCRCDLELLPNG